MRKFLQDIHKNKKNSEARKDITVTMNGEKYKVRISKALVGEDPPGYVRYEKSNDKTTRNMCEMLLNHVFDPETGEPMFTAVDILADSGYSTVHEFFTEQIPAGTVMEITEAINDFTDIRPRQAEIDEIKN